MKLPIKEPKIVDEGKHNGVIIAVEYRDEPYKYTDVIIELEKELTLKAGYPTTVTKQSGLGRLLMRFGAELVPGKTIDPDKVLIGKTCSFITLNEETDKGTFAKVVPASLAPIKAAQKVKE